jgi:hypothetical protein
MNKRERFFLAIIGACALAFLIYGIFTSRNFGGSLFSLMTLSFILGLPFLVGYITVYICSVETVRKRAAAFFIPFIPIFAFFCLTLFFSIEGWACWLMIMPMFLIMAGLGGLMARHYKTKRANKTYVFIVMLLPFFMAPIERFIGAIPGRYRAYTEIDIHATKEEIWKNVTRVRAIPQNQDSASFTRFLGFPRPIRAELDKDTVGGKREAIFDKGLVFHEQVTAYEPYKLMVFTIHANPYEIPSTTMDKHIVVGGEFFDVLNGTYQLEKINAQTYRLHLFSNFKLNTTFNFYASIWAGWVMQDIQQNILKVIKYRAERRI